MTPPGPDHLRLEPLEPREVPTGLVEPFQRATTTGLPSGWSQTVGRVFAIDADDPGLGDTGFLQAASTGASPSRAWVVSPFAADVETSAAVNLTSPSPVQVFVRGQKLESATPSYYAASVTRGGEVQLIRVVDGTTTVLQTVRSTN
jgi:hypothetical protein